ncbi:dihydrofolate reductase [Beggiatoa alba]
MPWHLPADLAYFRRVTTGKPVIMGRKTYESIGRPLPQRENFILSQQTDLTIAGCQVVHNMAEILHIFRSYPETMVIGGGSLYRLLMPYAQRLYLTIVEETFAGDTYFPEFSAEQWREVWREPHVADAKNPFNYTFCRLERVNSMSLCYS